MHVGHTAPACWSRLSGLSGLSISPVCAVFPICTCGAWRAYHPDLYDGIYDFVYPDCFCEYF